MKANGSFGSITSSHGVVLLHLGEQQNTRMSLLRTAEFPKVRLMHAETGPRPVSKSEVLYAENCGVSFRIPERVVLSERRPRRPADA